MPDKVHSNKPQKSKHDKMVDKKHKDDLEIAKHKQSLMQTEENADWQKNKKTQKLKR